jgi:hypothetical protein
MKLQVDVTVEDIEAASNALDDVRDHIALGRTRGELRNLEGDPIGRFELLQPQEPLSDAEAAALPPIR